MGDARKMKKFKIFINDDVLYIYKPCGKGVYVVAVEENDLEGYNVKNMSIETNLSGQELEQHIVYAMSNYKPDERATELSTTEVYEKVDDMIDDISKSDAETVLKPFVLPEKKKTPVESILADILQLTYKERSDVLVALLDMM